MPRADLLALTIADLELLTNRGNVKRAQREVEAGDPACDWQESDTGELQFVWADSVTCTLAAGQSLRAGRCTCPATELCRHLIRSVLLYQKGVAVLPAVLPAEAAPVADVVPAAVERVDIAPEPAAPTVAETWNPGEFPDEVLAKHFKGAVLTRARQRLQQGLLVELVRGQKPFVRFHDFGFTLRFLVPHDLAYTHCDCTETAPCSHVPLAIWAFRELDPTKRAGLVTLQPQPMPVPTELLDALELPLRDLFDSGLAQLAGPWRAKLSQLESRCRTEGLIWPAEIVHELLHEHERYTTHEGGFVPERCVELVGELLIRADAIRSQTRHVPQRFVRGAASDTWAELRGGRLIGLGTGAQIRRTVATLNTFLQDSDTGTVFVVRKEFVTPTDAAVPVKTFAQLATASAMTGVSFQSLGSGQLLLSGGKRSPHGELMVGRSRTTANPQNFQWEQLKPPLLVEDFAELRARLAELPPPSLRPRRVTEELSVCRVMQAEEAFFNPLTQQVECTLRDVRGDTASLHHPFQSRGSAGTERLLARLETQPDQLRFVSGQVRLTGAGLIFQPIGLVFEVAGQRQFLQPWIDAQTDAATVAVADEVETLGNFANAAQLNFPGELLTALAEALLIGLPRSPAQEWKKLAESGARQGFLRLAARVHQLASACEQQQQVTRWDSTAALTELLQLAVLARLAQDTAA